MNPIIKFGILSLLFILLFSVSISKSSLYSNTFSDNFDNGVIDSTWTKYADSGVDITEVGGVLRGIASSVDSNEKSTYIFKTLELSTNSIEVDYTFDFLDGMGRIYLIGKDATNTMNTWLVGLVDGWSGSNARPIIYGYDSNGVYQPGISWNANDISGNKILNSGGSGHIKVHFNSDSHITVDFSFPATLDDLTFKSHSMPVPESTEIVMLYFWYPPSQWYSSEELFEFDNYIESFSQDEEQTTSSTLNPTITVTSVVTSISTEFSASDSDIFYIAAFGSVIIGFIFFFSVAFLNNRKSGRKYFPDYGTFNPKKNSSLCPNCSVQTDASDIFCQNCGIRLQ